MTTFGHLTYFHITKYNDKILLKNKLILKIHPA